MWEGKVLTNIHMWHLTAIPSQDTFEDDSFLSAFPKWDILVSWMVHLPGDSSNVTRFYPRQ